MTKNPNTQNATLSVVAVVRREKDNTYAYRYEGTTLNGATGTLTITREASRNETERLLKKGGFCLITCDSPNDDALPLHTEVAQVGWRPDLKAFVTFHEALGTKDILLPPDELARRVPELLKRNGSLKVFQEKIAPYAKRSSTIMLALCSSFGSPLLALLGASPFGLVLCGPSRAGKSTAQVICASTIGAGGPKDLYSLTATSNGLLEAAMLLKDHPFVIDELATAEGKKRDVYSTVCGTTYRLLGGRDKVRYSTFDRDAGNAASLTTSFILLLSSEHSPDDWAARAGELRDDGEKVRFIGVPVMEDGCTTIFDSPPRRRTRDKRERREWERKSFKRLARRLSKNRGYAFPAFMQYVTKDPTEATKKAQTYVQRFEREAEHLGRTAIDRQVISNFGIIYAGGAIACDAGILPFAPELVMKALLARCRAALGAMPDPDEVLRNSIALLRKKIRTHIIRQRPRVAKLKCACGFRPDAQKGDVVVRAKSFADWFATSRDRNVVLQWLDSKGYLKGVRGGKRRPSDMAWAESQPVWPDRSRPRSIQICLPNGLKDLKL